MNEREEKLVAISNLLMAEYRDGLKEGIADGVRVAERILTWFLANQTLREPKSIETLEQWSRDAIAELLSKL
jgi:hypothetical protein